MDRDVEHHHHRQRPDQELPGQVDVMDGVAGDGDGTLLDGRNVGILGVREDDGSVGPLHDDLQVDVVLAKNSDVVMWRYFHGHEDWDITRTLVTVSTLHRIILR